MKKKYIAPAISCVEMEDDLMDVFGPSKYIRAVNKQQDSQEEQESANSDETDNTLVYVPSYNGWGDGEDIE